jgi:hypothetical protein
MRQGAGDLRRAVAAVERLATIFGDEHPAERRDAGVLLLHAGHFPQARGPATPAASPPPRTGVLQGVWGA